MAKSKYENTFKKSVVKSGEYKKLRKLRKLAWKLISNGEVDPIVVDEETGEINYYSELFSSPNHCDPVKDCAARLINSKKRKISLTRKMFKRFIKSNKDTHWITLTFTDEVLRETTYEQRRLAVREFLYSHGVEFVGTVDYGSGRKYMSFSNELRKATWREHYHVLVSNFIDVSSWPLGEQTHIKKTGISDNDIGRISQYISEASVLAIAHTEKNTRLIYSRKINPLIRVHISTQNSNILAKTYIKNTTFYTINNAIFSINKSKTYPIYMDNVL